MKWCNNKLRKREREPRQKINVVETISSFPNLERNKHEMSEFSYNNMPLLSLCQWLSHHTHTPCARNAHVPCTLCSAGLPTLQPRTLPHAKCQIYHSTTTNSSNAAMQDASESCFSFLCPSIKARVCIVCIWCMVHVCAQRFQQFHSYPVNVVPSFMSHTETNFSFYIFSA